MSSTSINYNEFGFERLERILLKIYGSWKKVDIFWNQPRVVFDNRKPAAMFIYDKEALVDEILRLCKEFGVNPND